MCTKIEYGWETTTKGVKTSRGRGAGGNKIPKE